MGVNTHTDFESRPRYGCGYDEKQRERQGRPCKGVMGKVMAPANVGEGKETVYRFDLGLRSVERKRGEKMRMKTVKVIQGVGECSRAAFDL